LFIYLFIYFDQATRPIKHIKAAGTYNIVMLPSHSTVAVDKRYFLQRMVLLYYQMKQNEIYAKWQQQL